VYGTEDHHVEMRCRLTIEMALNPDKYLDAGRWGMSELDIKTIASISDQFSDLSSEGVRKTLEMETLGVVKNAALISAWQLMAASEMLSVKIGSIYPVLGWASSRELLNRMFVPQQAQENIILHIMWSSNREGLPWEHWTANHVLPLVPSLHDIANDMQDDVLNTGFVADMPQVGEFYHVDWHGRQFVGQVVDLDDNLALVSFLAQTGDGLYYWPSRSDRGWEPVDHIRGRVELVLDELRSSRRKQFFNVH
jgi:hypothetical protein